MCRVGVGFVVLMNESADDKRGSGEAGYDGERPTAETRGEWPVAPAHGSSRTLDPDQEEAARRFSIAAANLLKDDKCEDVVVLDVRGKSQVTDFFLIGSGTSQTQMRAASQHVVDLAKKHGLGIVSKNVREPEATWILVDLVDVIVHLFEPETRDYYDLEMLWGDAPRVAWAEDRDDVQGDGTELRNRAGLSAEERDELLGEEE